MDDDKIFAIEPAPVPATETSTAVPSAGETASAGPEPGAKIDAKMGKKQAKVEAAEVKRRAKEARRLARELEKEARRDAKHQTALFPEVEPEPPEPERDPTDEPQESGPSIAAGQEFPADTLPGEPGLESIHGIGPAKRKKLKKAGITSLAELRAADPARVAKKADVLESVAQEWRFMAQLIDGLGVGPQFAEMIAGAGVVSIEQLATADPKDVWAAVHASAEKRGLPGQASALEPKDLEGWIASAKNYRFGTAGPDDAAGSPAEVEGAAPEASEVDDAPRSRGWLRRRPKAAPGIPDSPGSGPASGQVPGTPTQGMDELIPAQTPGTRFRFLRFGKSAPAATEAGPETPVEDKPKRRLGLFHRTAKPAAQESAAPSADAPMGNPADADEPDKPSKARKKSKTVADRAPNSSKRRRR